MPVARASVANQGFGLNKPEPRKHAFGRGILIVNPHNSWTVGREEFKERGGHDPLSAKFRREKQGAASPMHCAARHLFARGKEAGHLAAGTVSNREEAAEERRMGKIKISNERVKARGGQDWSKRLKLALRKTAVTRDVDVFWIHGFLE